MTEKEKKEQSTTESQDEKCETKDSEEKELTTINIPIAKYKELLKKADERDDFLNTLQRVQAEFLNYQKRVKKERKKLEEEAKICLLKDLLPVLDMLFHAQKLVNEKSDVKKIIEGLNMFVYEVLKTLENCGIKKIDTKKDDEFDPNIHEAISVIKDEKKADNIIIEEVSSGYIYKDKIIKHSKVIVNKTKT